MTKFPQEWRFFFDSYGKELSGYLILEYASDLSMSGKKGESYIPFRYKIKLDDGRSQTSMMPFNIDDITNHSNFSFRAKTTEEKGFPVFYFFGVYSKTWGWMSSIFSNNPKGIDGFIRPVFKK